MRIGDSVDVTSGRHPMYAFCVAGTIKTVYKRWWQIKKRLIIAYQYKWETDVVAREDQVAPAQPRTWIP